MHNPMGKNRPQRTRKLIRLPEYVWSEAPYACAILNFRQRAIRKYGKELMGIPFERDKAVDILRERYPPLTDAEYKRYEEDEEAFQPTIAHWRYDFTRRPSDRYNLDAQKSFVDGFLAAVKAGKYAMEPPNKSDLTEYKITRAVIGHLTYVRKLYNRKDSDEETAKQQKRAYAKRTRMATVCSPLLSDVRCSSLLLASNVAPNGNGRMGRVRSTPASSLLLSPC